jgi:endonuclease YncB( thermonuclease family)
VLLGCTGSAYALDEAIVIDGDTLRVAGRPVRLWGIDAPELHQVCADRWPAGIEASRKLRELVTARCRLREPWSGRMIGLCRADGVDIEAAMVRAGMAWGIR